MGLNNHSEKKVFVPIVELSMVGVGALSSSLHIHNFLKSIIVYVLSVFESSSHIHSSENRKSIITSTRPRLLHIQTLECLKPNPNFWEDFEEH